MADPLHEYTVQEILNKTNNYNSYQYIRYEGDPGIGGHADRSADLGITAANPAQELTILEMTASTGPIQLTINDGDHIYLKAANLPFTWDKLPVTKLELGSATVNDDLAILAYFN